MANLKIEWVDHKREPQCKPDPNFPEGKDLKCPNGEGPSCRTELPYPAKRCGLYIIECQVCGLRVGITTAGRPDDPRSVEIRCEPRGTVQ